MQKNGSSIRIRIRIHLSEAWVRGSGSTPKCDGFATLFFRLEQVTGVEEERKRSLTSASSSDLADLEELQKKLRFYGKLFWLESLLKVDGNEK